MSQVAQPWRHFRAVVSTAFVVAMTACVSLQESKMVSVPAPVVVDVGGPATSLDAGAPDCKTAFLHGSFCDELRELWRVVQSKGAMRDCIRRTSEDVTSALPGIVMYCSAHHPWGPDCAGRPPGQSDVVVECRLALGYEYGDKEHEVTQYVEKVAAAVAACDRGFHAAPLCDVGSRDKAIGFSHVPEPSSPLQKVVSVCSDCGDLPADKELGRPEVVPAHYDVAIDLYGVAPDAGVPTPHGGSGS